MPIWEYNVGIARSSATADVFTAIAQPRRREVLGALARGERDVTRLVAELRWPQPQVSKHLGVLRRAGLVSVRREGRNRLYSVNGQELQTVYDWVKGYERFWEHQLQRIRERAEREARSRQHQSNQ